MKYIIVIFLFSLSVKAHATKDSLIVIPPDSSVATTILAFPLSYYIGKPVDSLLSVLPGGYTNRNFMPVKVGYIRGISQSYFSGPGNNCVVEIFIDTFQHLPIPNRTKLSTWNWSLAKQETIAYIKVYKNNFTCLYGCNNDNYQYP